MKTVFKRLVSIMLAVIMVVGSAPLSGFVGLELPEWLDYSKLFSAEASAETLSGTCGENLTWKLDTETGELVISGTGDMTNWTSYKNVPWYSNRSRIEKVVLDKGVTSIGDVAFEWCSNITDITIADSVTCIGKYSFDDCDDLTSITFPDTLSNIGESAFDDCDDLTSVTFGNGALSIGNDAFYDCDTLTNVTFGNGALSIGDYAFFGCDKLTRVSFGNDEIIIGNYAFGYCGFTNFTIPKGVTNIGYDVFWYTPIQNFSVHSENQNFSSDSKGVLYNKDKTVLIKYPKDNYCTDFHVSNSVITIKTHAFSACANLERISIPDSVTNIESNAFYKCEKLTDVEIGKGVDLRSWWGSLSVIFSGCYTIENIEIDNSNPAYKSIDGVVFEKSDDDLLLIYYPPGRRDTSYDIPEGTTDISLVAFENSDKSVHTIESLKIPNTLDYLSYGHIEELDKLQEIIVEESHPNLLCENNVLFDKDKTCLYFYLKNKQETKFVIPDTVRIIYGGVFENATNLVDITIPESVKSINSSFYNCGYYNDLDNWQDGVLYLDNWILATNKGQTGHFVIKEGTVGTSVDAFNYRDNITELTIPSSFKYLDSLNDLENIETLYFNAKNYLGDSFYLENLTTVYFGDTVEELSGFYFYGEKLKSVVFMPTDSLKKINLNIFKDCENLNSIILPDSVEEVVFDLDTVNRCSVVHIPSSAKIGVLYYETTNKDVAICSDSILSDSNSLSFLKQFYGFKVCDGSHSIPMVGKVTGVDIPQTKIQMSDSAMLMEATVYPETAENKDIVWSSSNPNVAIFQNESIGVLTAIGDGYTVVTATTVDGRYSDSCIVFVGEPTMVVSSKDGNQIIEGDTHEFMVSLLDLECLELNETGPVNIKDTSVASLSEISFVIENNSVATIESVSDYNNSLKLNIKGVSAGTTYVTMSNNITKEVKYLPIYVSDGENTYLADSVPKTDDGQRGVKNFNHSGILVYDYVSRENGNGTVDVSFTAYNINTNNGSVEVYDSEGNLEESYMLEAHNGGDVTGVWENIVIMGEMVETWINLDPFDSTSPVWSTSTSISVTIPEDGYIKITNDVSDSIPCLVHNIMDFTVSLIDFQKKEFSLGSKSGKVVEETGKTVLEAVLGTSGALLKSILGKIVKKLDLPNIMDDKEELLNLVQELINIIEIDFETILLESIEKVLAENLADIGLGQLGVYGKTVKGLYAYNELLQLYNLADTCRYSIGSGSAYIYAKQDGENIRISNGIVYEGDRDTETVFRTYAIAHGGEYSQLTDAYDAEDIKLYDISLVKNGDTVQPSNNALIYIRIPDDWVGDKIKVYRLTMNGAQIEYEDMNAHREGNYMVFETDHFSYYTLINEFNLVTSVLNPSTTTISYSDSIILHAETNEALPSGWTIKWTANNGNFDYSVSADGSTCTITPNKSGDTTFTATVYDENNNIISEDTQVMKSKAGFFDKLIAFFKKLFGLTKVIAQSINPNQKSSSSDGLFFMRFSLINAVIYFKTLQLI